MKNVLTVVLAGIFFFAVTAGVEAKQSGSKSNGVKACQKDKDPNTCAKVCKAGCKCQKCSKDCNKSCKKVCKKACKDPNAAVCMKNKACRKADPNSCKK